MTIQPIAEQLEARLQLTRPIVFLDLESTQPYEGARPNPMQDRIIQVSVVKLHPTGEVVHWSTFVNPTIPITEASREHHRIQDAQVADAPIWRDVGPGVIGGLRGCDLAGYNVRNYDVRLIRCECERNNIHGPEPDESFKVVDAYQIAAQKERRDLAWAYQRYTGKVLEGAHDARMDAQASMEILAGQLAEYDDLPAGLTLLQDFCFPVDPTWADPDGKLQWANDEIVLTFGDWAGTPILKLPTSMVSWILKKDFSPKVKQIVNDVWSRKQYPLRPQPKA